MSTMDLDLIISVLTVIQIIFIILGMVLRSMIIYFEQFGRDPQKRSLLNRVSWYFYVLKDHILVCFLCLNSFHCCCVLWFEVLLTQASVCLIVIVFLQL